jgi:streptomycin 6-kinase
MFVDLLDHRRRNDGPGRFPASLLDRAVAITEGLLSTTNAPVVLHGDLHHSNVLRAERAPWLAIDPKGLVGDRGFEVAAFVRNPSPQSLPVLQRRLTLIAGAPELDPQRTRDWCFAEAMLNAAWSHHAPDFDERLTWAELMLRL